MKNAVISVKKRAFFIKRNDRNGEEVSSLGSRAE